MPRGCCWIQKSWVVLGLDTRFLGRKRKKKFQLGTKSNRISAFLFSVRHEVGRHFHSAGECLAATGQIWKPTSLIEGGGDVLPQLEGAEPMVSTRVAPSFICA